MLMPLIGAAVLALSLLSAQEGGAVALPVEPEIDPHRRGSTLYVVGRTSSDVTALSRETGEILAVIPVGRRPSAIDARRDGDRIYVACSGAHTVEILDGARRVVLDTVPLTHGSAPEDILLGPDGTTLFVAATGRDAVIALDASSLLEVAEIPVGRRPMRLAIDRDGRRLYVLAEGAGRVEVIDTATRKVEVTHAVGTQPSDLALDPETGTLFVARAAAPILHAIMAGSAAPRELGLEAPAVSIAIDAIRRRLAAASPTTGSIHLISAATGASLKVIRATGITRVAGDPEGRYLYALDARRNLVVVFNQISGVREREIAVGKEPWDLVLIR